MSITFQDVAEKFGMSGKESSEAGITGKSSEWNDFTRMSVAKDIKQQGQNNAFINIAIKNVGTLAKGALNAVIGKKDGSISENLLNSFCKSTLKEAVDAGLGAAVSGALTVFSRSSKSSELRNIPSGAMTAVAFDALDKIRVLYQAAGGKMNSLESAENFSNSIWVTLGLNLGQILGSKVGMYIGGLLFGATGTILCTVVCTALGGIAGTNAIENIYEGTKKIVKFAKQKLDASGQQVTTVTNTACNLSGI